MQIILKKLHSDAKIPLYQSKEAAGADIFALLDAPHTLPQGKIFAVPTGLSMEIPEGYEVQIRARSGLASKGLILPNGPGTIDSDYRGEVKVLLLNLSGADFIIEPAMRIAQAVIAPVIQAKFTLADSLSATERGEGGFGSTGIK